MPAWSAMTPLGLEMMERLPAVLYEDPDIRAVIHCHAKEAERLIDFAQEVRDQFFPASATIGLPLWEFSLGLTIAPEGLNTAQRRAIILGFIQSIGGGGSGIDFENGLTRIIGPGWTYFEHDPDDSDLDVLVPEYNLRVALPYAAYSDQFNRIESIIRAILLPANLRLTVVASEGGYLDDMELDDGVLG